MPNKIRVYDQYETPWDVTPEDSLWQEAQEAAKTSAKIIWPLHKILANRGFGWWTVFRTTNELLKQMPPELKDPSREFLVPQGYEIQPAELESLLQWLGGCSSYLQGLAGGVRAELVALRETYRGAISVGTSAFSEGTEKSKEARILAGSETVRETKRRQIQAESTLTLLEGWSEAYTTAWSTVSRLITLHTSEVSLTTGRRL